MSQGIFRKVLTGAMIAGAALRVAKREEAATCTGMSLDTALRLKRTCHGFEDPEEMCPRHPDDCRCCEAHAILRGWEQGDLDEWPDYYAWLATAPDREKGE